MKSISVIHEFANLPIIHLDGNPSQLKLFQGQATMNSVYIIASFGQEKMGVYNQWTGLLDWTTGLPFHLAHAKL